MAWESAAIYFGERDQVLCIGTEAHGLLLRGAGPFEPVVSTERLASAVPQALLRTRSGELWVGTSGAGVMRLDEGALLLEPPAAPAQTLTVSAGLPSNFVRTLLADDAGLWIGTNAGAAYWDGRTATLLDPSREPWPARGLLSDEAGGLWLVNKEQGLVHYTPRAPASPSHAATASVASWRRWCCHPATP